MKKRIISLFLALCIICLLVPMTAIAETDYPTSGVYPLDGTFSRNNYVLSYDKYDRPRESFLSEREDGGFDRIQIVFNDDFWKYVLIISQYDADMHLTDEWFMEFELEEFGGFFAGAEHYYLVFGQYNMEESDETEVVRIVKFTKDWTRVDACSIYGANTSIPFGGGTLDMTEEGGKLYVHTSHVMYKDPDDGFNHQANEIFVIDQATMEWLSDEYHGYVSHSFSQNVRATDQYLFCADHGDAYPRAVVVTRTNIDGGYQERHNALAIQGEIGDNDTGVSMGDMELSSTNCLVVGISVDQFNPETYNPSGVRNVFLSAVSQEMDSSEFFWLTDYSEGHNGYVGIPHLTKITDDVFLIMWEHHTYETLEVRTNLLLVDGNGKPLTDIIDVCSPISECKPIVTKDGLVTWFGASNEEMKLYQISWRQLLDNPEEVVQIHGHRFGEWEVYTRGNCIEPDVMRRVCPICSTAEYKSGELGKHNFSYGYCTICGAKDNNPFKDVKSSDYFFEPVLWAVENGITSGVSATRFAPSDPCTRAQVVTFLWRAAGEPQPASNKNPFRDVKSTAYYYDAVLWAVEQGITTGMSATSFGPNSPCTRGQVVTFLHRAAGAPEPESAKNPFSDVKSTGFYYDAVLWAVENGITTGTSATRFSPGQTCTRGQVVTFLYRAD